MVIDFMGVFDAPSDAYAATIPLQPS